MILNDYQLKKFNEIYHDSDLDSIEYLLSIANKGCIKNRLKRLKKLNLNYVYEKYKYNLNYHDEFFNIIKSLGLKYDENLEEMIRM